MIRNIFIVVTTVWIAGASYWYVCKVRENCETVKAITEKLVEDVAIDTIIPEKEEIPKVDSLLLLKQELMEKGIFQIFFDYSQSEAEFSTDAIDYFNKIKKYLEISSDKKVYINAYSDNKGSDNYNLNLCKLRAEFVKNKLVGLGVANKQIEISVKGEIKAEKLNKTEQLRKQNRRTDIFIKQ